MIVLLLKPFFPLPLSYGVLHLFNQSPSSRTLVALNSQISWGWRKGGGWEHVDVACKEGFLFVWGSLVGGLMLMSLFHLGKKRKKPHRPIPLPLPLYSTHLFGVCSVSLHICARHHCPLLFRCLCKICPRTLRCSSIFNYYIEKVSLVFKGELLLIS